MKKLLAIILAVSLLFTMAFAVGAEETESTSTNAIIDVIADVDFDLSIATDGEVTFEAGLPLHRMIEAGIFGATTPGLIEDIIENNWEEVASIPELIDEDSTTTEAAFVYEVPDITFDTTSDGAIIIFTAVGVFPDGEPAIEEDFTYAGLFACLTEDDIILTLADMIIDVLEEEIEDLEEEIDNLLTLLMDQIDEFDQTAYKNLLVEYFEALVTLQGKVEERNELNDFAEDLAEIYDTEYTLIGENGNDDDDDEGNDENPGNYEERKMQIINRLREKLGNCGTENAAGRLLRNLERKMAAQEDRFGDDDDDDFDDNDTKTHGNSRSKSVKNNGKGNGNGKK